MSDLTKEVLDELERLEREAMPGRWDFRSTLNNWPAGSEQPETLIEWIENDIAGIDTAGGKLMATLRNHATALIEAARERDRLREALELIVREQEKGPINGLYHGGETYCGLGQRLRNVAVAALKGIEINTVDA